VAPCQCITMANSEAPADKSASTRVEAATETRSAGRALRASSEGIPRA
jgi:hypothetical protein